MMIASVLVFASPFSASCSKTEKAEIREVHALYGVIRKTISTSGTIQPQNRIEIKPPISGRVEAVLVREGQRVKRGRVIALLSSTERAALLDAARAQGEEAVHYWDEVYKPTPLLAPIDGDVIVRAVEPGQTVTANDIIAVLSDRLIIKAQVDETDIGRVRLRQQAEVSLDAYPDIRVPAYVDHISYESKIVNNVTIYEVDIMPKKVPDVFRSGMSATVEIIEAEADDALLLPREAVQNNGDGSYVLVREGGGRVVQRPVKTGMSNETHVQILEGLRPDDTVVIKTVSAALPKKNNKGSPLVPFGGRRR